jgi:hypothetical protein
MPSVFASAASAAYDLAFQVSPIILVGGSYANSLGGGMPILGVLGQLPALGQGLITNGLSADDFFARYLVEPGGTLINFTIGKYPFANQQVAANAVIQQPKNVSLRMICPVKDQAGYLTKLAIMTSLQTSLEQHVNAGGTFNVATPAFLYTNGILIGMTDITSGTTNQKQIEYQLDFEFPLISQNQAQAALNTLMGKVDSGQPLTSPTWSGQFGSQGIIPGGTGLTGGVSQSSYVPSVIMQ